MSDAGWPMMRRFGESWGAPICEELEVVDTPVGELCIHCLEEIAEGDAGVLYSNGPPTHADCYIRQAIGGVNHILGRCTCCGGNEDPDPPGMTRREAARAAVRLFEQRGYG